MAFDDRLLYLAIGFVLGYFVRILHEVRSDLDEVSSTSRKFRFFRNNEKGSAHRPSMAQVAITVVVLLAFYSAFVSQRVSNNVVDSQDNMEQVVKCNRQVLVGVISTLNQRATYAVEIASANIDLQQAQSDFFEVLLHKPAYSEWRRLRASTMYYDSLQSFLGIAEKNRSKVATNPLPTIEDFSECMGTE